MLIHGPSHALPSVSSLEVRGAPVRVATCGCAWCRLSGTADCSSHQNAPTSAGHLHEYSLCDSCLHSHRIEQTTLHNATEHQTTLSMLCGRQFWNALERRKVAAWHTTPAHQRRCAALTRRLSVGQADAAGSGRLPVQEMQPAHLRAPSSDSRPAISHSTCIAASRMQLQSKYGIAAP